METLPVKLTPTGHDAYCHVCWNAIYILWVDKTPPDNKVCPHGARAAHACPDALAQAQNAATLRWAREAIRASGSAK